MTDKEIIQHLQHNKYSLAIKGLYNILPAVKQYIKDNNGTADDAQDIFQDALVVIFRNVHHEKFELKASIKTYLLAIVKNCWLQELRQRKKIPVGVVNDDIAVMDASDEAGFNIAEAAFNLLGEKCRQLLILFYFKKQSFKEIAASLSFVDEKTAKNKKYRCLQKAKENYLILSNNSNGK